MADGRIRNLTDELLSSQIQALLNTLFLVVDDASLTNANKILLKSLLTTAVVTANTNNYQAMTPKAFYDSVATDTRFGVSRLATDAEVNAKTLAGVLNSAHQVLMQTQWYKDWFVSNNSRASYPFANALDTGMKAISFEANVVGTITNTGKIYLGPVLPATKRYNTVYYKGISINSLYPTTSYSQGVTGNLKYNGAVVSGSLPAANINMSEDGKELYISNPYNFEAEIAASVQCNCIIVDI